MVTVCESVSVLLTALVFLGGLAVGMMLSTILPGHNLSAIRDAVEKNTAALYLVARVTRGGEHVPKEEGS